MSIDEINWGLIAPLLLGQFVLMIAALASCLRAERTSGPKWVWALVIVFISLIGPVLYFTLGRRND